MAAFVAEADKLTYIPGVPFPEYYEALLNWKTPVVIGAVYATTVHMLNPSATTAKLSRVEAKNRGEHNKATKSNNKLMTLFVFLHNTALALYSGITFYNMVISMHKLFNRGNSIHDAYCDKDGFLWNDSLGYWGYLFYLSKFYEVIDTAIILLKGRRSSLLQTYHHAGAMITMWAGIRFRSPPIWIFVVFNSLIHSIMYTYYAMTSIGLHPPGKRYLTSMQISQFLVGMSCALSYLFLPNCLATPGQKFAVILNVLYLLPLTYLFVDFARKTYGKRVAAAAASVAKKAQ
ncbi:ELO family [Radiomyces spectabilis]|uniref:ELO family n=1 Tax=Radiomyces spectabilis TaxID=64574 RepID=UPI00221F1243|nr:ELO family [Radiomyces spectabilis]KAI8371721.1 ELO family [Radiomyces spectabilis]